VIFDVGTFIGTYAVFEALWSGPSGGRRLRADCGQLALDSGASEDERRPESRGADQGRGGRDVGPHQISPAPQDSDQNSIFPLLTPAQDA
jgi:hypothetical protein